MDIETSTVSGGLCVLKNQYRVGESEFRGVYRDSRYVIVHDDPNEIKKVYFVHGKTI